MLDTPMARQTRIHEAVAAIPCGRVASYGEIAARAGLPGRARMVGRALRETPADMLLPWHRVLRADGRIALAENSQGWREQCKRLRDEGVMVHKGRVALQQYGLHHDLDRELWGLGAPLAAPPGSAQASTNTRTQPTSHAKRKADRKS